MKNQKELKDGMSLNQLGQALGADKIEMVPPSGNGKAEDDILRQATQIQRAKNEHLTELLTGKSKAPNKFIAYMLEQMKNLRAEGEALNANINQAERQLQQMHDRSHALQAAHDKYIQDIQQWDRPLNNKAVKEEKS